MTQDLLTYVGHCVVGEALGMGVRRYGSMEIWGGRGNEVWCGDGGVQVMCEGEGVAM